MSKRAASGSPIEDVTTPVAKKARTTSPEISVDQILKLSESTLKGLKKETLVGHIVTLQNAWSNSQAQNVNGTSSQSATVPAAMDPAKIKEKADKASDLMFRGIKKQMKWQPSCKFGGKSWSYDGVVASPAVFYRLFRLQEEKKQWKQKKISKEDLFRACGGEIQASIRYGTLSITSEQINLRWNKEENTFKVSGKYGV